MVCLWLPSHINQFTKQCHKNIISLLSSMVVYHFNCTFFFKKHFFFFKVQSDILTALDSGSGAVLSMLDLSAAFDTIDRSILLSRLHSLYGISGDALDLICQIVYNVLSLVTLSRNAKI